MAHPKVIVLAMLSAATPGTACHLKHDLGEFFHGPFMWDERYTPIGVSPRILAHRTSDDEQGVCIVISLSRYLDSITILRFGEPGSLGHLPT